MMSENNLRWNGKKGHYEVYYIKFNELNTGKAFWLRYTILSPYKSEPKAELWAMGYNINGKNIAMKKSFSISSLKSTSKPFSINIGENWLGDEGARGEVSNEKEKIKWDIKWKKNAECFRHYPYNILYILPFPHTKLLSPNIDILIDGEIKINNDGIIVNSAPGEQSHIWGNRHAFEWTWAHCNAFDGQKGVFESLSARTKANGRKFTILHINIKNDSSNERYTFNSLRCMLRAYSEYNLGEWKFSAVNGDIKIEGNIKSDLKNIVGVEYEDPDGEKIYCYNSKLGDCEIRVYDKGIEKHHLISHNTTAIEYACRNRLDNIPISI